MVEHLLELIQRPRILHDLCRPPQPPKPVDTKAVARLINRISERRQINFTELQLISTIFYLHTEAKFIWHFPKCRLCKANLMIDVERYGGCHTFWYLALENEEYLAETYDTEDFPLLADYHIGNYWEQVKWFEKHGNTDVPGENTFQFILDRAKWAFKIYGKQIHAAREMLRLLKAWDFSEATHRKYMELWDQLGNWQVNIPFDS